MYIARGTFPLDFDNDHNFWAIDLTIAELTHMILFGFLNIGTPILILFVVIKFLKHNILGVYCCWKQWKLLITKKKINNLIFLKLFINFESSNWHLINKCLNINNNMSDKLLSVWIFVAVYASVDIFLYLFIILIFICEKYVDKI